MFLDASAIIAILADEEDSALMLAKVKKSRSGLFYSPVTFYEAVAGLARKKAGLGAQQKPTPLHLLEQAEEFVERFLAETGAMPIAVTVDIGRSAVGVSKTYGRAVGHRAKLNFGDCFAYACARSRSLPLLFKGNDFVHTDIERA
jgi:ribonuclease VapC